MKSSEILHIILAIIVLAFSATLAKLDLASFLLAALFFAIIFLVNILVKKLTAYYLEAGAETKIWQFQRFGFKESHYLKTPIPIGIILPLLVSIASLGNYYWLAATQTEIRALKSRVAKKHDFYSYSELTEFHIASICAAGIAACLILAFLAYLFNLPELGKLAIFFSLFNMLPLGNLDGTKIFFGSLILWFVLGAITLIAVGYALFLP